MTARLTVADVVSRAAHLITGQRSGHLSTHSAWVCTPASTVPEQFRAGQVERHAAYMASGDPYTNRITPGHAVAYWVESYGQPIAWVTLDGRTHYAGINGERPVTYDTSVNGRSPELTTKLRHRDAVRAVWPERFVVNSDGPTTRPVVPQYTEGQRVTYRQHGEGPAEPGRVEEVVTDPRRQAHVEGQYDVALDDGGFVFAYASELTED